MGKSIVIELQELASDGSESITNLLRKVLIVATKLRLDNLREWVENELNGYGAKPLPPYRVIRGGVQALHPHRGWIPVAFEDPQMDRALTECKMANPIAEIEAMSHNGEQFHALRMAPELQAILNKDTYYPVEHAKFVSREKLAAIVDAVRNTILHWALNLEQRGILGDGLQFSASEKQKAAATPSIQITGDVYGHVGAYANSADGSTNTVNVSQSRVFNELRSAITSQVPKELQGDVLTRIDGIENAGNKKTAIERINELTTFAANVVTIWGPIAPFIPVLMQWAKQI